MGVWPCVEAVGVGAGSSDGWELASAPACRVQAQRPQCRAADGRRHDCSRGDHAPPRPGCVRDALALGIRWTWCSWELVACRPRVCAKSRDVGAPIGFLMSWQSPIPVSYHRKPRSRSGGLLCKAWLALGLAGMPKGTNVWQLCPNPGDSHGSISGRVQPMHLARKPERQGSGLTQPLPAQLASWQYLA